MPQLLAKKRDAFFSKSGSQGLRSLIGCSFLRAYWLFLERNISFINVRLRLCCVLNMSVIRN